MYFVLTETSKHSYAYEAPSPINLTQSWYTNSGLARTPKHLIHYMKSCVNHYTTGMSGGDI